jgi:hypothetical protein
MRNFLRDLQQPLTRQQKVILFVSSLCSMLAGATVVHNILRPNLEISTKKVKA